MKSVAALATLASVLALSAQALAGGMDLRGLTASHGPNNAFTNSRELLPVQSSPKNAVGHANGLASNNVVLKGVGGAAHSNNNANPACPEPASLAALAVGCASVVRRRKAKRG